MSIIVFVLGTIIGSFLNLCIYRIPKEESIIYPSSYCEKCNAFIKAYDLVPIISYIVLKGKCRYCKNKISISCPAIEFLTGSLFLSIYNVYGLNFSSLKYMVFICFMIVIGLIDLHTMEVYSKITISAIIVSIFFILLEKFYFQYNIKTYVYGVMLSVFTIGSIVLITKAMGTGDVDIAIIVALFLGVKFTVITLSFSFVFGSLIGLLLVLLKKKARKEPIAFGPFISIAAVFSILFGERIFLVYMCLF